MILYLSRWFPEDERARILSAFLVALPLSSVVGAPISATLLDLHVWNLKGWQWLFLCEGLPAFFFGIVTLAYLTDSPSDASWLSDDERAALLKRLGSRQSTNHLSKAISPFKSAAVWMLSAIYFALLISLYGFNFWLPQVVQASGANTHWLIGGLVMVPNIAAVSLMYAWGRQADRRSESRWPLAAPLLLAALGFGSAVLYSPNLGLLILSFSVAAVGIYCALPAFWSRPTRILQGAAAAAGIALINAVGNIGGYVGSILVGRLKDATGGFTAGLGSLTVSLLIAGTLACAMSGARSRSD
jgi:MFS transporter, ACS family, tartrate transporter